MVAIVATSVAVAQSDVHAQDVVPLPAASCNGSIPGYPGSGYVPLGYIRDGLVVAIQQVFRYSSSRSRDALTAAAGADEDWNLLIVPIGRRVCPDGSSLFGRDCRRERERFVDIFWAAASEEWKIRTTDLHAAESSSAPPAAPLEARLEWGKRAWGGGPEFRREVHAEFQVSTVRPTEERESFSRILNAADLVPCGVARRSDQEIECDEGPYPRPPECSQTLCGEAALVYGTAVADTAHDGGKPELHPLRALVTQEGSRRRAYKVRAFADYGKAGLAGSGTIAGRICENWIANGAGAGGEYLPYVFIDPASFVFPATYPGSGSVISLTRSKCELERVLAENLFFFPESARTERCDWFRADPWYRAISGRSEATQVKGGWGVANLQLSWEQYGNVDHRISLSSPTDLRLVTTTLGSGIPRVSRTAHTWEFTATSHSTRTADGVRSDVALADLEWSLPRGAQRVEERGNRIKFWMPIAPLSGDTALAQYRFRVSATGRYEGHAIESNPVSALIPRPAVLARATRFELVDARPPRFRPTFTAAAEGFAGRVAVEWRKRDAVVARGPTATLELTEADTGERLISVRANDGFEEAISFVDAGVPATIVTAERKLGGDWATGRLQQFSSALPAARRYCLDRFAEELRVYREVELIPTMSIQDNPYGAPPATAPAFAWSDVECPGPEGWRACDGIDVERGSGASQTLRVTFQNLVLTHVRHLPRLRVKLSARDAQGRDRSEIVYFNNVEPTGRRLEDAGPCIDEAAAARDVRAFDRLRDLALLHDQARAARGLSGMLPSSFIADRLRVYSAAPAKTSLAGALPSASIAPPPVWKSASKTTAPAIVPRWTAKSEGFRQELQMRALQELAAALGDAPKPSGGASP